MRHKHSAGWIAELLTATLALGLAGYMIGCLPTGLTPQTKSVISQDKQTTAITIEKSRNAGDVAEAKAKADGQALLAKAKAAAALGKFKGNATPIKHPIEATNNTIVKAHKWLFAIFLASFVLWMIWVGLSSAGYTFMIFLKPIFRWVWICSGIAVITLPWLPLCFACVGSALLALIIYELIKDKGNVKQAVLDTESTLGIEGRLSGFSLFSPGGTITLQTASLKTSNSSLPSPSETSSAPASPKPTAEPPAAPQAPLAPLAPSDTPAPSAA